MQYFSFVYFVYATSMSVYTATEGQVIGATVRYGIEVIYLFTSNGTNKIQIQLLASRSKYYYEKSLDSIQLPLGMLFTFSLFIYLLELLLLAITINSQKICDIN
ncbi:unnamed protein product [Ceratitis capitata]|uniref:(Mediterranean fruit fly) hypothetical protein n=1 Tax=Ceratitis capitata TaxID=7213 RepID=A0A811V3Y9_CERCA|nr:unnamed protein product [Ceratitis capitata]